MKETPQQFIERLERATEQAKEFRVHLEETAYLLRLAAWKFWEEMYRKREGKP